MCSGSGSFESVNFEPPGFITPRDRSGSFNQPAKIVRKTFMYHRERICFSSTLNCNKKEEKNHQTSHFERAPLSINQATLSVRAHFNQPINFERARPFQPERQEFNHLHASSKLSPSTTHGLGPPCSTCPNSWCTLLPHTKAKGAHTPLLPF